MSVNPAVNPKELIQTVKKINLGKYIINDSVIISGLDYGDEGVSYKLDYDENMIKEKDAVVLGDEFIRRLFINANNDMDEDN